MARSWDQDESVPLYFVFRVLICILLPWTLYLLWWLRYPGRREISRASPDVSNEGHRIRNRQTKAMAAKRAEEIIQLKSRIRYCTCGFILQTSFLAVLWVWFAYVVVQYRAAIAKNLLYEGFDPYGILRVDNGTSGAELNRAYRREAFKYHPDKNSDPTAIEKFFLVRKAFDSLTEPEAMDNFKTFGNPDGPQYVELFAISSFIKDKDASRLNGQLTYKKRMFRAADIQVNLLGIVVAVLVGVAVWNLPLPVSASQEE
eukprot:TRINITY_DN67234_c0_g1_i1.p1 TRINITY_DN67234_c0_g1~~TRINITY_DN67234_c0_g1_i1.p1  ORF type:complete len:276 (-),score=32.40 TRINITY_DN67234_c0_g1_i1:282-1055(-)